MRMLPLVHLGFRSALIVGLLQLPVRVVSQQATTSELENRDVPQLTVRTHCNPGVRHPVASITWKVGTALVTAPGGTATSPQQIDLTTSRSGFDHGLYVKVWPLPSTPTQENDAPGAAASRSHELDPARKVRAATKSLGPSGGPGGPESNSIEVENLEAGVNYYWRVRVPTQNGWTASQVVVVQAPVCPVDVIKR